MQLSQKVQQVLVNRLHSSESACNSCVDEKLMALCLVMVRSAFDTLGLKQVTGTPKTHTTA